MMHQNINDSLLAMAGGAAAGTYVAQTTPGTDPWVTQILVPFLGAVLVPFFKELSMFAIKYLKDKHAKKIKK